MEPPSSSYVCHYVSFCFTEEAVQKISEGNHFQLFLKKNIILQGGLCFLLPAGDVKNMKGQEFDEFIPGVTTSLMPWKR